jgi:hypothetical protein
MQHYRAKKKAPPTIGQSLVSAQVPEYVKLWLARAQSTDAKAQAAVIRIKSLEDQLVKLTNAVSLLSAQVLRSHQFILQLLDDPEAQHHAKAMMKDYFNTRPEST